MATIISAGSFVTSGERATAELLAALPDNWTVICNRVWPTPLGDAYEIDFLVVARRTIFVLDHKLWRGPISGNNRTWQLVDGATRGNPLNTARFAAQAVASGLRATVPELYHLRQHFAYEGVVLPAGARMPRTNDPRNEGHIFFEHNVVERLQRIDGTMGSGNLAIGRNSNRIVHLLEGRLLQPAARTHIGDFRITDSVKGPPHVRIFYGVNSLNQTRELLVYDVSDDGQREFLLHEARALHALHASGLVPQVGEPFTDGDRLLVVPVVPPDGTLLSLLKRPDDRAGLALELRIAAVAAEGLAELHRRSILHRALSPEALTVQLHDTQPRVIFSRFHAARFSGMTVAGSLNDLKLNDPYAASEVALDYGSASVRSDAYSLLLIFLERIADTSVEQLLGEHGRLLLPDLATRWQSIERPLIERMNSLFSQVLQPTATQPMLETVAGELAALAEQLSRPPRADHAGIPTGSLLDGRYQVLRTIAAGRRSTTLLVRDTSQPQPAPRVAKLYHALGSGPREAHTEFAVLRRLQHDGIPTVYEIGSAEQQVHLVSEFIDGNTLQAHAAEWPWPAERWWQLAQQLIGIVATLEQHGPLLHRDIKPANIMIRAIDQRALLIDFGLATEAGRPRAFGGTLPYFPPGADALAEPDAGGDRYALAVTLYQVLTGEWPFDPTNRSELRTTLPADAQRAAPAAVLLRWIADSNVRSAPISALLTELRNARLQHPGPVPTLTPNINQTVAELRGLYRSSGGGNADNRGYDSELARRTYVSTALDTVFLPHILQERPTIMFLCGNPGDGKTAFLAKVGEELKVQGAEQLESDASGWEFALNGHTFRACYDASEAHGSRSADDQLHYRLRGLDGDQPPQAAVTVLVAINDGRLIDFFERFSTQYHWLAPALRDYLRTTPTTGHVWLIDLKRRSLVHGSEQHPSLFRTQLEALVGRESWDDCTRCSLQHDCAIRRNVMALRNKQYAARLEYLLQIIHLQRHRHITMRDLRSALAYLITGNLDCEDVHAQADAERAAAYERSLSFWQLAFTPEAGGDQLLAEIERLDPAVSAQPLLERFLQFHQSDDDRAARQALFSDGGDVRREHFSDDRSWLDAMRRRLFFSGSPALQPYGGWKGLLPYRYADEFQQLLRGTFDTQAVIARLAQGLNRTEGIFHQPRTPSINVRIRSQPGSTLTVVKELPVIDFDLQVIQPSGGVEQGAALLQLRHRRSARSLAITLDLYEVLMRCADGLDPQTEGLQSWLEDLAPFKNVLQLLETNTLVLYDGGAVHTLSQRDGKLVLTVDPKRAS